MLMLAKCCELNNCRSFRRLAEKLWGDRTAVGIQCALIVLLWSACVSYMTLVKTLLIPAIRTLVGHSNSIWDSEYILLPLCVVVIVLPLSLFRRMSELRYNSLLGLLIVIYTVGVVVGIFFDWCHTPDVDSGRRCFQQSVAHLRFSTPDFMQHTYTIVLMSGAFAAQPTFLPIYFEMKDRTLSRLKTGMWFSFAFSLVVYTAMAYFGYFTFPDNVQPNLLSSAYNKNKSMLAAQILLSIYVISDVPLFAHAFRKSLAELLLSTARARSLRSLNVPAEVRKSYQEIDKESIPINSSMEQTKGTLEKTTKRIEMSNISRQDNAAINTKTDPSKIVSNTLDNTTSVSSSDNNVTATITTTATTITTTNTATAANGAPKIIKLRHSRHDSPSPSPSSKMEGDAEEKKQMLEDQNDECPPPAAVASVAPLSSNPTQRSYLANISFQLPERQHVIVTLSFVLSAAAIALSVYLSLPFFFFLEETVLIIILSLCGQVATYSLLWWFGGQIRPPLLKGGLHSFWQCFLEFVQCCNCTLKFQAGLKKYLTLKEKKTELLKHFVFGLLYHYHYDFFFYYFFPYYQLEFLIIFITKISRAIISHFFLCLLFLALSKEHFFQNDVEFYKSTGFDYLYFMSYQTKKTFSSNVLCEEGPEVYHYAHIKMV
ncbi:solute carrier family 38, member 4 isoform 2 [Reticulomyxa filosa]|uniref:Solute carrier family 38, member 4 isoform 2 n=1 Tax=Reticulomyxa filosa TaxID=46433 RepID=X6MUW2_RETFI|nr:solute carrier family 38, member 4 isoform 2 [Reticulomyxa filosa]|eukprot:ETO17421.1 solute carrier family 38, member 4 isoform 2 [Reticulomyxa filosa]